MTEFRPKQMEKKKAQHFSDFKSVPHEERY